MADRSFEPVEGGVKIVFDVRAEHVAEVMTQVGDAGFDVRRYYRHPEQEHRPGGSAIGYVRLGAEQATQAFTEAEEARIVAAFEAVRLARGISCTIVGVDSWQAGGGDGRAGVREPRRPTPQPRLAGARVERPS